MEYDSQTKRNDVLIHAPTWMNPENIVKSVTKVHLLYHSIYMKCLGKANLQR